MHRLRQANPEVTDPRISTRLADIRTRIIEIDKRLVAEYPEFASFSRPQPVSSDEVQASLDADEALVLFLDMREMEPTPEETGL